MVTITVRDLIEKCGCRLFSGNLDEVINECFVNSREVRANGCFFGIKGDNVDGSLFYKEAFLNGASVCVINETDDLNLSLHGNKTIVISKDTLKSLQELAKYKRKLFKGEVIGITGSVGKTSTRKIITNILESKYKVLSTNKNHNSQIGLPLTILRLTNEDIMVLEMGMSRKGEMHNLSIIAKPTIAVITNVLDSHIENLGSRKKILDAKLEILDGIKENGYLIINNDNDMLNASKEYIKNVKLLTYGIFKKSNLNAYNVNENIATSFDTNCINEIKVLGGKKFIYNALAGITVGKLLNIDINTIKNKINNYKNEKHRLEVLNLKNNITLIDDTYNASYESVTAALDFLSMFKKNKIAILGDILELGNESKKIHEKIGMEISKKGNVNTLITIGKYSKQISKKVNKKSKIRVKHFKDYLSAIRFIKNIIKPNDVILVKASNGIRLINLVNYIKGSFNI